MLAKTSIIIGVIIVGVYIISLIWVVFYERKINKLEEQKQNEIDVGYSVANYVANYCFLKRAEKIHNRSIKNFVHGQNYVY